MQQHGLEDAPSPGVQCAAHESCTVLVSMAARCAIWGRVRGLSICRSTTRSCAAVRDDGLSSVEHLPHGLAQGS